MRTIRPPHTNEFEKRLAVAEGYFQRGMWNDSWNELEELAPEFRHLAKVVVLRVLILNNFGNWEDASIIGEGALRHYPDFGVLCLATTHAVRNCRGAAEAKVILMAGAPSLRTERYSISCLPATIAPSETCPPRKRHFARQSGWTKV